MFQWIDFMCIVDPLGLHHKWLTVVALITVIHFFPPGVQQSKEKKSHPAGPNPGMQ